MSDVKELQAMIVHLTKRIEKLEGKKRLFVSTETYISELKKEANKLL